MFLHEFAETGKEPETRWLRQGRNLKPIDTFIRAQKSKEGQKTQLFQSCS